VIGIADLEFACDSVKAIEGAPPHRFRPMYAEARGTRPISSGLCFDTGSAAPIVSSFRYLPQGEEKTIHFFCRVVVR
jgi:hypothetical protein